VKIKREKLYNYEKKEKFVKLDENLEEKIDNIAINEFLDAFSNRQ
jgi:hypothetical protein